MGNSWHSGRPFTDPLKVNDIDERTSAHGVDVDGVLLKDGFIELDEQATDPATPSATETRIFVSNGSATERPNGVPFLLTDHGPTNQFLSAFELTDALPRQMLVNGGFDIWQRNTTFTTPNDDTYGPDRWNFLVETNGAWTFARDTGDQVITDYRIGTQYELLCTNATLNNQCGIVQILPAEIGVRFAGTPVSLSFYAKTVGTEISNLRAAILTWSGTDDSVTSDVVGTWASDGTDPTWAANWTANNTPSNLALTASYQRFSIENVELDDNSNIAIVIWVDDGTITAGDRFFIGAITLNQGAVAIPFKPRSFQQELLECQRYCYVPDTVAAGDSIGNGHAYSTTQALITVPFPSTMRTTPTLTATAGDWQVGDGTGNVDLTSISLLSNSNATQALLDCGVAAGLTQFRPYILVADATTNRRLIFSSEL